MMVNFVTLWTAQSVCCPITELHHQRLYSLSQTITLHILSFHSLSFTHQLFLHLLSSTKSLHTHRSLPLQSSTPAAREGKDSQLIHSLSSPASLPHHCRSPSPDGGPVEWWSSRSKGQAQTAVSTKQTHTLSSLICRFGCWVPFFCYVILNFLCGYSLP